VFETTLSGQVLRRMFRAGASRLERNASRVNELNVFPVPDGDTGTNMNLTFRSGIEELEKHTDNEIEKVAAAFSRGLLFGARGNSGVILSQLFRGFAKGVANLSTASPVQLAEAFSQGVDMAYKAVMKPVEGTILSVAREAAIAAKKAARNGNAVQVIESLVQEAKRALANTPNQLPILKEVGVVDSGGQGLVYIYEGFQNALSEGALVNEPAEPETMDPAKEEKFEEHVQIEHHFINPTAITYGYCTEFMVHLTEAHEFSEGCFRNKLSQLGDSLLVVSDENLVKVHIHAEEPGTVLTYAQQYGSLDRMKIENMRLQHEQVLKNQEELHPERQSVQLNQNKIGIEASKQEAGLVRKPYGLVAAASGEGIIGIFKSLGVSIVIEGGQTMNPSTEQFLEAIADCHADHVIILPNNKNILMAAQQAAELAEVAVEVVPSRTIPQGLSAVLAFTPEVSLPANGKKMTEALGYVKTGLVTHAVRDTKINDLTIHDGDFMGLVEGDIIAAESDLYLAAMDTLVQMVEEEHELITIFYGEGILEGELDAFLKKVEAAFPSQEIEVHNGGQPVYSFILAAE
jgi:uncharacterized protein